MARVEKYELRFFSFGAGFAAFVAALETRGYAPQFLAKAMVKTPLVLNPSKGWALCTAANAAALERHGDGPNCPALIEKRRRVIRWWGGGTTHVSLSWSGEGLGGVLVHPHL